MNHRSKEIHSEIKCNTTEGPGGNLILLMINHEATYCDLPKGKDAISFDAYKIMKCKNMALKVIFPICLLIKIFNHFFDF